MQRSPRHGASARPWRIPYRLAPVCACLAGLALCVALPPAPAWAADTAGPVNEAGESGASNARAEDLLAASATSTAPDAPSAPDASATPDTSSASTAPGAPGAPGTGPVSVAAADASAAGEVAAADTAPPPDQAPAQTQPETPAPAPAKAAKEPFHSQIWLDAGFLSYHFKDRGTLNAFNWGFGAAWRFTEDFTLVAGTYRNSMRAQSTYGGLAWQPLHLGPFRLGVMVGAIRGYPDVDHGRWFPLAVPVLSVEFGRIGANLVVVPTTKEKGTGCVSLQIKVRVW
ncbi:hypothetical protein [Cupriavidus malaysiensis]|uniref:hypothetical protein n=1 Tax=Cupriavidus malaysiensis TaxID=367825 RepID=UPI000AE6F387|nr:hypothetical protein [Cupriavidus malaysiensis]